MRKSTEEQAQSIGLQQASIERGAQQQGYEVTAWFKDEGVSGTIPMDERPDGRKLFEHLRAHPEVRAVFFDDITRMERSPDLHCYSHRLYEFHSKYKVVAFFVSDQQRSDSPHMSDFLICMIKGLESSEYSKKLSFKTARGQIAVVQNGCVSGRQAPYGMDRLLLDVDGTPLSRWVVQNDGSLQKFNIEGTEALDKPIPSLIKHRRESDGRSGYALVQIGVTEPIPKTRNQRVTLIIGRDKKKVETVRFIFDTFVNASIGLRGIAGELNQRGIPPPCTNGGGHRRYAQPGQPVFWRTSTVRYILTNPAYYGAITYNRRCLSKFWRIEKEVIHNERTNGAGFRQIEQGLITHTTSCNNPVGDWVDKAVRPEAAIISREVFERAQRRLQRRSRNRRSLPRDKSRRYLLSGLVHCQCGSPMNGRTVRSTKRYKNGAEQRFTYRTYHCSTYHSSGGTCCSHNSVDCIALESFVLRQAATFLTTIISPANVARKTQGLLKGRTCMPVNADQRALREKLEQVERSLAGLPALDFVAPALRSAFAEQRKAWEEERTRVQEELSKWKSPAAGPRTSAEIVIAAEELLHDLQGADITNDACRLREILNRCIADIRLHFQPVQQGKRTLYQLERGELVFQAKPGLDSVAQPGRLFPKGNRGDWI
ncbi:MAG: recombinase family protein [Planctomycetota bacterium]